MRWSAGGPEGADTTFPTRYGYQTNTRVKFVLVLALADAIVRDLDVKTVRSSPVSLPRRANHPLGFPQLFRAMHNAYIAYISNPFTSTESENPTVLAPPIRSLKFSHAMDAVAGETGRKIDDAGT